MSLRMTCSTGGGSRYSNAGRRCSYGRSIGVDATTGPSGSSALPLHNNNSLGSRFVPLLLIDNKLKPPFILRVINGGLKVAEKWFDQYKYSEDECLIDTVSLIQRSCSFPAVPIAVVSGTQKMPLVPQKAFAVHLWYQEKLLQLSPNARHYLCENSSHFPQITEPQKVLSAIFDTLDAVKSKV